MADLYRVTHDDALIGDGLPTSKLGITPRPKFHTTAILSRDHGITVNISTSTVSPSPLNMKNGDVISDDAGTVAFIRNYISSTSTTADCTTFLPSQLEWKALKGLPTDNPQISDYVGNPANFTKVPNGSVLDNLLQIKAAEENLENQLAAI
ncbi:hypothetical protein FACS189496_5100 [Bacilli bacterium]|nr:hypothetical protein FACS189496_5100 [Bacilli bacterium]